MSIVTEQERAVSNNLEHFDTATLAARAAVLTALASEVKDQADQHRAELYRRMQPGSKITGRNPFDKTLSLGSVDMSDPDPEAFIEDRDAFDAYCRATWPEEIEVWTEINADDEEVVAILREHAPHLVTVHSTVPGVVREKALELAVSEDVPGTKRRRGLPQLSVNAAKNARSVARSIIAASPVLRELEA